MADTKISALTSATTPLAGTEVLPIVQSGVTVKVPVSSLTAGRSVTTGPLTVVGGNAGQILIDNTGQQFIQVLIQRNGAANSGGDLLLDGNTGNMSLRNLVAGAWAIATGTLAGSSTDRLTVASGGDVTVNTGNLVIGTSGKGIDFSATPGTGTSELLADYEEGTWTPLQGSGLTVVGTFSSSGTYTKIGRQVTVQGKVSGSTSISCSAFGIITSTMPFSSGATAFLGSLASYSPDDGGTASTINGVLYSVEAVAASSGGIEFTIVLFV
jgi:hypothetical protein